MAASKSVVVLVLLVVAAMVSLEVVVGQDDQGPPVVDCPTLCHANCHHMPKFIKLLCYKGCLFNCYYVPFTTPLSDCTHRCAHNMPTTQAADGEKN